MTEINVGAKLTHSEMLALSELDATKLIISIIITFLFWFALAIALLVLFLFRSSEMTRHLISLEKVSSYLGLSVVGMTVLTWRINLFLLCKYYKWYAGKYVKNS